MPSLGLLLAICGAASLIAAVSLFLRVPQAPARVPPSSRLTALSNRVSVLDGDTLRVGDHVVRLAGIVAPARGSVCHGAGHGEVDCGTAAANALASLVRGNSVDCAIASHDGQGRPAGTCLAGATRLNETLVAQGWARAKDEALTATENAAKAAGRGMWQSGS